MTSVTCEMNLILHSTSLHKYKVSRAPVLMHGPTRSGGTTGERVIQGKDCVRSKTGVIG